jgi:hypothetical protein
MKKESARRQPETSMQVTNPLVDCIFPVRRLSRQRSIKRVTGEETDARRVRRHLDA